MDLRLGMTNGESTTEFYIDNVTDERAEISNTFVFDRQRVSYIRPMTMGIRYKRNFQFLDKLKFKKGAQAPFLIG